jgi:predicted ATPase
MQNGDLYIRAVELRGDERLPEGYPFDLEFIKNLGHYEFDSRVTFIVGENGSGKSTLIEAIAVAYGFNAEGGSRNMVFSTKSTHSVLNDWLQIDKGFKQPKDGYFLRAESYYNVASNIDDLDMGGGGRQIKSYYGGKSLHEQSHGESFMALMKNRLGGKGMYIFDEPEAALSPTRQLELLAHIHRLVDAGSQFIIATHSPILMAYPGAVILEPTYQGLKQIAYEDTKHFQVTKSFLLDHRAYTDRLK